MSTINRNQLSPHEQIRNSIRQYVNQHGKLLAQLARSPNFIEQVNRQIIEPLADVNLEYDEIFSIFSNELRDECRRLDINVLIPGCVYDKEEIKTQVDAIRSSIDITDDFCFNDFIRMFIGKIINSEEFAEMKIKLSLVLAYVEHGTNSKYIMKSRDDHYNVVLEIHKPTLQRDLKKHRVKINTGKVNTTGQPEIINTTLGDFIQDNQLTIMYDNVTFLPYSPKDNNRSHHRYLFNIFTGFRAKLLTNDVSKQTQDDLQRLISHIYLVLANSQDNICTYILKSLAHLVQYPAVKVGVANAFVSEEGAGKNLIFDWFCEYVIGPEWSITTEKLGQVTGRFNSFLEYKVFVVLNEATSEKGKFTMNWEEMKSHITEKRRLIEKKFMDSFMIDDYSRWCLLSNKDYPFRATEGQRRYFATECSNQYRNNREYLAPLIECLISDTKRAKNLADAFMTYLLSVPVTIEEIKDFPVTDLMKNITNHFAPPLLIFLEEYRWSNLKLTANELLEYHRIWCNKTRKIMSINNAKTLSQQLGSDKYKQYITRQMGHNHTYYYSPVLTSQLDPDCFTNLPETPVEISKLKQDIMKVKPHDIYGINRININDYI